MVTNEVVIRNADLVNSINRTGMTVGNQGRSIDRGVLLSNYTDEAVSTCWRNLCSFIAQNYNQGKGTIIKGLGAFTFNNYEVNLEGTTNQFARDKKQRTPVFLVSPEFLETLKPGQYTKNGLIYYTQKLNNGISHVKVNYAEMAYANSLSKDECSNIISHLIKHMGQAIRNGTFRNKDLPGIGVMLLKGNILGVQFNEAITSYSKPQPQKLRIFKRYAHIGMDLGIAQNCCASELVDPYGKAEELRPQTSLITKLTKKGNEYLKKNLNINIKDVPVHNVPEIYFKQLSQSQESGAKFINDRIQKPKVYIDGQKLKDLNLTRDVLESFEFFKSILISSMKKKDKSFNGKIKTSDCIAILASSNIHSLIDEALATKIVSLYSKSLEEMDYMQFIASLIKDAKMILFSFTTSNLGIETSKCSVQNCKTMAHTFASFPDIGPSSRSTKNSNAVSMRLPKIKVNSLQEQKKDIDSIKKELNAIQTVIPDIKLKNRTRLDQNISIDEFMNILSFYSISYPKQILIKILQFLEIDNINKFNLNDIEEHLNKFIVLRTQLSDDDIQLNFRKIKDIFFFKGGKEKLFAQSNELTQKEFCDIITQHTPSIPSETVAGIFNYLVKTNRAFTVEDYTNFFENDKPAFDENYELKAMRTVNAHIAKKHFRADEYFDHLLTYNVSTKNKVLSRSDFIRIFQAEKFSFSAEELNYLFGYIDEKKDEVIDREEFLSKVNYVMLPLSKIQHIIQKNSLDIEDLAHRMDITIGANQRLGSEEFLDKIKRLDYTFSNEFLSELFNSLKEKPTDAHVNTEKIIAEFNVFKTEFIRSKGKTNYIPSFKAHFNKIVKEKVDFSTLKAAYEEIDEQCTGIISKADYCSVMKKFFKEFTDQELVKFVRITNMYDENSNVRYPDLLNLLYYRENEDKFTFLCHMLKTIIDSKFNGSIEKLLMRINNKDKALPITIEALKSYLQAENQSSMIIPLKTYCKLDVDADGLISLEDINSAEGRYSRTSFFKYENKDDLPQANLYSSETMKESKFKSLVKKIKAYMKSKNITEIGLFRKLDLTNDGFISAIDFNYSIDKILPMAPSIKDQFFNYLDYYHNGMVDLETFIYRFKDFSNSSVLPKNNNKIENVIIEEFASFIKTNSILSETELFSLMDKDSDSIISIHDFKRFITDNLLISKYDFNDHKIERVMQAISLSKNKMIGFIDIKEFVNKTKAGNTRNYHMNLKEIFKITTNQNLYPTKDNTEWINEIIERFGMFISEKYRNVAQFFEENIEKGERKFRYEDFARFHYKNHECFNNGFNLTKDELLAVFTSLDSQKKNFLLLEDLETKLQVFDFYKKMHIDVKSFIKQNFFNGVDAFKFFLDQKGEISIEDVEYIKMTSISKKNFFDTFEYFFPKKYATETILRYFEKNFKSSTVSFSEFNYLYFDSIASDEHFLKKKMNETKLLTSRNDMNRSHSQFRPKDPMIITPFDDDSLNKLKRIIQSTKFDLDAFFAVAGLQAKNGIVNKFQFRNMIKKLDLGLTNLEIDQIIAKSGKMSYEGNIDLNEFIKYLKGEDSNIAEGKQNTAAIIANIKDLIYKYYSNPIVCFQMNDKKITLRLDFERFKRIITDMYNRDSREAPSFTMLKNVYDVLDLRKDGIIDMNEWTRAFGSFNASLDLKSTRVENGFSFFSKKKNDTFLNVNRKILREWESSGDISQIYKQIARNKKALIESLKDYTIDYGGTRLVLHDNLVSSLRDLMPITKLSATQWKMLVMIGKSERENLIDLGLFFSIIEKSAKNMNSHPKKF